jgi:hypothetical protein
MSIIDKKNQILDRANNLILQKKETIYSIAKGVKYTSRTGFRKILAKEMNCSIELLDRIEKYLNSKA